MTTPCFDPVPHWLQIPLVMTLLIAIGACWGFVLGSMWVHFVHYKFKEWFGERRASELGTSKDG